MRSTNLTTHRTAEQPTSLRFADARSVFHRRSRDFRPAVRGLRCQCGEIGEDFGGCFGGIGHFCVRIDELAVGFACSDRQLDGSLARPDEFRQSVFLDW